MIGFVCLCSFLISQIMQPWFIKNLKSLTTMLFGLISFTIFSIISWLNPLKIGDSAWIGRNDLKWYAKFLLNILSAGPIPHHIGFIMDGNRRFARKFNVGIRESHSKGFDKLTQIIILCAELGVKEVTVYAFSINNFNRLPNEVEALFNIFIQSFNGILKETAVNVGIRIRLIGNIRLLPEYVKVQLTPLVKLTKNNTNMTLNVAIPYTSQDEIANSFEEIRKALHDNKIQANDINENLISKSMYSGKSGKVDLLIRTSEEMRFSDFMLWQSWNANVLFRKALWPELSIFKFVASIFYYQMHYSKQEHVETLCKENEEMNERINSFLENLEKKRSEEMQIFV